MRLPTLFIGHGSPLHALGGDAFARSLARLGEALPRPRAIIVVSAHWRTSGVRALVSEAPETIHDFSGFPPALYALRYPAPGAAAAAARACELLAPFGAEPTLEWGLDHGAWTILRHMFPKADVPVTQLSLDRRAAPQRHLEIAAALAPLRDEGILLVGSGSLTHNLGDIEMAKDAPPADWAVAFDAFVADALRCRDVAALTSMQGPPGIPWRRAHPTLEHYVPLLYALGASEERDAVSFPHEGFQHGTLSMRAVRFG